MARDSSHRLPNIRHHLPNPLPSSVSTSSTSGVRLGSGGLGPQNLRHVVCKPRRHQTETQGRNLSLTLTSKTIAGKTNRLHPKRNRSLRVQLTCRDIAGKCLRTEPSLPASSWAVHHDLRAGLCREAVCRLLLDIEGQAVRCTHPREENGVSTTRTTHQEIL